MPKKKSTAKSATLIARIRSGKDVSGACEALTALASHGAVRADAADAFRELVSLASKTPAVARLLVWLVTLGEPGARDLEGKIRLEDDRYGAEHARALVDVAIDEGAKIAALLDDPDALVRAHAAHLLGLLGIEEKALRTRLAIEKEDHVRRSLAIALGEIPKTFEALRDFFIAFAKSDEERRADVSWNGGALDGLVIVRNEGNEATVARALASALSRDLGVRAFNGPRADWPNWILRELFEERPLGAPLRFSSLQQELLRDLSMWPNEGRYEKYGIPDDLRSRRRALGIDPPSVMEREIGGEPLWKRFLRSAAVDLSDLSIADRLDAHMHAAMRAWGIRGDAEPVFSLASEASREERAAFVERWVADLRACPWPEKRTHAWIVLWVYLRDHDSIPPELDDVVGFYGVDPRLREVLASIPLERRLRIARRELATGAPIASRAQSEKYADLFPGIPRDPDT